MAKPVDQKPTQQTSPTTYSEEPQPGKIAKLSTEVVEGENTNTMVTDMTEMKPIWERSDLPVAERFSLFLAAHAKLVAENKLNISHAKQALNVFWHGLSQEDKTVLYTNNAAIQIGTRMKQIAESLVSDIPLLLAQYNPNV